jgi:DNA-binding NtrC family response regulator
VLLTPPLSERPEDIAPLARTFLRATCRDMGIARELSDEALDSLKHRSFPGNVRELRHVVTRAAVFSTERLIDSATIDLAAPGESPGAAQSARDDEDTGAAAYASLDFRTARARFERDYLHAALARHDGNITAAAAAIGMAQSNLSRKLKELGIR